MNTTPRLPLLTDPDFTWPTLAESLPVRPAPAHWVPLADRNGNLPAWADLWSLQIG